MDRNVIKNELKRLEELQVFYKKHRTRLEDKVANTSIKISYLHFLLGESDSTNDGCVSNTDTPISAVNNTEIRKWVSSINKK